jgi:uncharacterized protein (DUF983 family)
VTCPSCGNKPISFARFLVTLNPWRIQCASCGTDLRAGPTAYTWVILHLILGFGLVSLYQRLTLNGVINSSTGVLLFVAATLAIVFLTAYVIPWMFLSDVYRVDE